MKRSLLTLALCTIFGTAHADGPERFPAISQGQLDNVLRNIGCNHTTQNATGRNVGNSGRYRAYGLRICGPDHTSVGTAVLWLDRSARGGPERLIPTMANGQRLPRPDDGGYYNDGGQMVQWSIFAFPLSRRQYLSCGAAIHNYSSEPFAATFCEGPYNFR